MNRICYIIYNQYVYDKIFYTTLFIISLFNYIINIDCITINKVNFFKSDTTNKVNFFKIMGGLDKYF